MSIVDRLRDPLAANTYDEARKLMDEAAGEIWCLREIVRGVRIMANAGNFKQFEGEPWLKRVQNISLES